jgi:predicted phosphodiesterase
MSKEAPHQTTPEPDTGAPSGQGNPARAEVDGDPAPAGAGTPAPARDGEGGGDGTPDGATDGEASSGDGTPDRAAGGEARRGEGGRPGRVGDGGVGHPGQRGGEPMPTHVGERDADEDAAPGAGGRRAGDSGEEAASTVVGEGAPGTEVAAGDGQVGPRPALERARALYGWVQEHRHRERSRWWSALRLVIFSVAGAAIALALMGHIPAKVGPFETTFAARPSLEGHTVVHLAPLGTIDLDTHDAPLTLDARVDEIGVEDAERIANNPRAVERLGAEAAREVRSALVGLAVRCLIVAVVGGAIGALVARTDWRAGLTGALVAGLLVAVLGGGAALTFDANAVSEPRYSGLLTRAPAAVGDVEDVLDRFGEYRAQLGELVDNVATLYLAGEQLPTFEPGRTIRILHVSDIHLNPGAFDLMRRLTDQFSVDAIADTGDITDWGTDPETALVGQIATLDVPYVWVRGNHDSRSTQAAIADIPNAVVLDGEGAEVAGLQFWGIGDPRYTPDKSEAVPGQSEQERARAFAPTVADRLERDEPPQVDVAMVHDSRMAAELGGQVPLVLAGHGHVPRVDTIEPFTGEESGEGNGDGEDTTTTSETTTTTEGEVPEETMLLVEGSTGGGGLRALQGDEPLPLTASVLYFDPTTHRLLAYDRVRVSGLGGTGATIDRHIIGQTPAENPTGPVAP